MRSSCWFREVLLGTNLDEGSYFLIYYLTDIFKLSENVRTTSTNLFLINFKPHFFHFKAFYGSGFFLYEII
jgi:hypothetical protein